MEIKPIIVREYLESLKESEELDYIFPLFLESQGYIILSKPTESKGLSQYGKDVIAVGKDFEDGIKKRFYFELKGGNDRHINDLTYNKRDGIRDSLIGSKDTIVSFVNKKQERLPLKIVLVHNGELKTNIEETFKGFIQREFPKNGDIEFDRWGISELTGLFSEKFFGAFLLASKETTKLFNKTIINLDADDKVSNNFIELLDLILNDLKREEYNNNLPRKWKMGFESLRLISFIIYTESKGYNNLDISKRYLTHLIIRLWSWILKNKLEEDKKVIQYINKIISFYLRTMNEYFQRTSPIAKMKDGLFSEVGGRYEQVGYTFRTFEYLQYLCWFLRLSPEKDIVSENIKGDLVPVINMNSVGCRPLLDIHSAPIIDILKVFIEIEDLISAKNYLAEVLSYIRLGKEKHNRLPDANNSEKNVIKYVTTSVKPVYYSDSTSPLLAVLMEFIVILDMEKEFYVMRDFINTNKIDLGLFVPHHGVNSTSSHLIEDKENDLEEQLFSKKYFNDGYQSDTNMYKDFDKELSFEDFKEIIRDRKDEFSYQYRTDKAGYSFLKDLAHIYFRTPYFPDKWRNLLN